MSSDRALINFGHLSRFASNVKDKFDEITENIGTVDTNVSVLNSNFTGIDKVLNEAVDTFEISLDMVYDSVWYNGNSMNYEGRCRTTYASYIKRLFVPDDYRCTVETYTYTVSEGYVRVDRVVEVYGDIVIGDNLWTKISFWRYDGDPITPNDMKKIKFFYSKILKEITITPEVETDINAADLWESGAWYNGSKMSVGTAIRLKTALNSKVTKVTVSDGYKLSIEYSNNNTTWVRQTNQVGEIDIDKSYSTCIISMLNSDGTDISVSEYSNITLSVVTPEVIKIVEYPQNTYNNINRWEYGAWLNGEKKLNSNTDRIRIKEKITDTNITGVKIKSGYLASIQLLKNGTWTTLTNFEDFHPINCEKYDAITITCIKTNGTIDLSDSSKLITFTTDPYKFKKWAILGDSITDGGNDNSYTDSDGNTIKCKYRYWHYMLEKLNVGDYVDYGIAGTSIAKKNSTDNSAMSIRYANMDDDCDLITVLGGINDGWFNNPIGDEDSTGTDTFYGAVNTLCAGLREKYPAATIIFATPLHQNSARYGGTRDADFFRDIIIKICAKYGIPVFDSYAQSGIYPSHRYPYTEINNPNYVDHDTSDGLHLNDQGAKKLGTVFANFVLKYV